MSKLATERRLFGEIEIRGSEKTISGFTFLHGRAVPYNTPTAISFFTEEHSPGSFEKSIRESARALPLLLFHDARSFPIGATDKWEDGPDGLDGIWRLDDSESAQRTADLADKGILTGMSIGFHAIRSDWTFNEDFNPSLGPEYMDRVVRRESRLLETSVVSTPAFADASVKFVRSAPAHRAGQIGTTPLLDGWKKEMEKLRA